MTEVIDFSCDWGPFFASTKRERKRKNYLRAIISFLVSDLRVPYPIFVEKFMGIRILSGWK
jgi:hypothetical protein